MVLDTFGGFSPMLGSPAVGGFVIFPHDVNELSYITRALRIGTTKGTLSVIMEDGSSLHIPVAAYELLPLRVKKVLTATTVDVWGLV